MTKRTAVIIGCGGKRAGKESWSIGHAHAKGYLAADPNIRLLGVDPNPENLKNFGEKFKLPECDLFPNTEALYKAIIPDFASICTWPKLHAPQAIEASNHGVKGILCEKPTASNKGEIQNMLAACKKNGTKMAIGHQRRHWPSVALTQKLIADGVIGDGLVLEARVGDDWDMLSWSVHWFDLANSIFNANPEWVLAGVHNDGTRRYQHAAETASIVMAQYPENRQGIFITGPVVPHPSPISIRGSKGMLRVNSATVVETMTTDGFKSHELPAANEFATMFQELFDAVEKGTSMKCDVSNCATATEMAFAAHESARTIKKVALPLDIKFAPLELVQKLPSYPLPEGKMAVLADEHFGSGGREGIVDALRETTGHTPMLIDAKSTLTPNDLQDASVLFLYHTQQNPDPETKATLEDWVNSGKPMVVIHAALGAYTDWKSYQEWIGRSWVWKGPNASTHPYEESELRSSDTSSFPWKSHWLPKDEVFIKLGQTSECDDLIEAVIPQGNFPAAWTSKKYPNVGVWVPGHRRDLWKVPAMRDGLLAMIQKVLSKPKTAKGKSARKEPLVCV